LIKTKADKWFDSVQAAAIIAVSPWFIFPSPWTWWVFLSIPLLLIARKAIKNEFMVPTLIDIPVWIFLTALLVTTLRAANFFHSLPKIAGVLYAAAFFYSLTAFLKTGKSIKWALALFMTGGVGFSIIGLLGMPTFTEKHLGLLMRIKEKIPRLNFGLPGADLGFAPTVVGGMLLLVIPLLFVCFIYLWIKKNKNRIEKLSLVLSGGSLLITGSVLLLTQSRGAWGGLFISTVIMGIMGMMMRFKRKKILAAALIGLLAIGILAGTGIYSILHAEQLKPGLKQAEGTLLFRVQLWDLAIPIIKEHPMWGIGLNNFRIQVPEVRFFLSHAHNQFIHTAVEMGIPAAIAYIAILFLMGYMCIQVWKNSNDTWMKIVALGLGWGQLAHLFFCLTDAIPPGAKVGILTWFSFASITAIYNLTISLNETKTPAQPPPAGQNPFEKVFRHLPKLFVKTSKVSHI